MKKQGLTRLNNLTKSFLKMFYINLSNNSVKNYQWMLKLLGESLMRNRIITRFQVLFPGIIKGERVTIKQKPEGKPSAK